MQKGTKTTSVCNLAALLPREGLSWLRIWAETCRNLSGVKKVEKGYALRIRSPSKTVARIEKLAELEQKCCPFLSFSHKTVNSHEVELRVTATGRVREFGARLSS